MVRTTKALLHGPIFKLWVSRHSHELHKPTFLLRLASSKSVIFGGFGLKIAQPKTTAELIKTSAFRSGDSQKNVIAFQPAAFVNDCADNTEFMAEELGATINRLSKWVVSACFITVLLWKHDAESLWVAMGSVMNHCICVTLKRILNQQRPVSTLKSDPGMPSSHAQSIFYIFISSILLVVERLGVNEFTVISSALALACGSYLSWLRVSQQFHTISQVTVGAVVGSIVSILWFWLWLAFVLEAFISFWWVRMVIVLGATAFSVCFILHAIRRLIN